MRYLLFLLAAAVAAAMPSGAAAQPAATDFHGEVIIGGVAHGAVQLEWRAFETGMIHGYQVSRYEQGCIPLKKCATPVALVRATHDPMQLPREKAYTLVDTAPPGTWVYRVELIGPRGTPVFLISKPLVIHQYPSCGYAELCEQVVASLVGEVILGAYTLESVELEWQTSAEADGVSGYRLSRIGAEAPHDREVELGFVHASGTCGQLRQLSLTDSPPTGTWIYKLEVLDSSGRTACATTTRVELP